MQDIQGELPIYIQISEVITREINAGYYIDGQRLPTEKNMAKQYNVAVGTIRKSLDRLTKQGLIEKRHGSGNYICHSENNGSIYAFFKLEKLEGGGGLPKAKIISVDTLKAPKELNKFIKSDKVHRFRRLRFLDDTPAALEEIWLDGSVAARIDRNKISESLYHFYKEVLGIWISRAEDWISVGSVPEWTVDQFPITAGTTVGHIERFGWSQNNLPVEFSRTWFNPNTVRYVSRLK